MERSIPLDILVKGLAGGDVDINTIKFDSFTDFGYNYKCCQACPNNPKNNPSASGICHCTLPNMEMPIT